MSGKKREVSTQKGVSGGKVKTHEFGMSNPSKGGGINRPVAGKRGSAHGDC